MRCDGVDWIRQANEGKIQ